MNSIYINNKRQHPTSTVLQSRTAMFLPSKSLSKNFQKVDIEVINKHGTILLKDCKLTQIHRNIVDCIFSYYEPHFFQSGEVAFVFPKYDLLAKIGHKSKRNGTWLEAKFEEMRMAAVQLKSSQEDEDTLTDTHSFMGVISSHETTKIQCKNGGKDKFLYGVVFSRNFMKMFDNDINIYSQDLTHEIISLEYAVTQAFVRLIISHREVNKSLDEILKSIGLKPGEKGSKQEDRADGEISQEAYGSRKREILSEKERLLDVFGIDIRPMKNDGRLGVFYDQHKSVFFKKPVKE